MTKPSLTTRKYIYAVLVAAGVVAAGYGIGADEVERWLVLASAVLGVAGPGLALGNLADKPADEDK